MALAFPQPGLWWWAYAGLAPVLLLVAAAPSQREALWRCWSAGCGYFLVLYHWLLPQLSVFVMPVVVRPATAWAVRLGAAAVVVVLIGGAAGYGLSRSDPDVVGTVRVGGVQPGKIDDRRERLAAHEDLSRELAPAGVDAVVWGQSSVGFDLDTESWARDRLVALARELDRPVLVNVDARRPDGRISKTMVVVRPDGLGETYTKQRLVPFGEYIPMRSTLGWVERFSEAAEEDRAPGAGLTTLRLGDATVGPLVSYESTFPDMRRRLARASVDLTLVRAAATTFQGTWAFAPAGRLRGGSGGRVGRTCRAGRGQRYVGSLHDRGRRLAWVDEDETGAWTVVVPLSQEETLFVRWGDWVPAACFVVVVVAAASARRAGVILLNGQGAPPRRLRRNDRGAPASHMTVLSLAWWEHVGHARAESCNRG